MSRGGGLTAIRDLDSLAVCVEGEALTKTLSKSLDFETFFMMVGWGRSAVTPCNTIFEDAGTFRNTFILQVFRSP